MPTKRKPKAQKVMRMNNSSRFTIRNNAVAVKFDKREALIRAEEKILAYKIYNAVYTKKDLLHMLELPIHAFKYSSYFYISETPSDKKLGFEIPYSKDYYFSGRENRSLKLSFYLPMYDDSAISVNELPTSLKRKTINFIKKRVKLNFEKMTYLIKVHDFLNDCTSCKRMLELLPASYDWLPDVEGCSDVSVADKAAAVTGL